MVQPRLTDALSNRKVTVFFMRPFFFFSFSFSFVTNILLYTCIPITTVQVDVAQDLRGILIRIGRFKSLELHYTKVLLKPIKQLWDDFDSKQRASKLAIEKSEVERISSNNELQSSSLTVSFSSWLPGFYDELLLYLEQEWKWYLLLTVQCCSVSFLKVVSPWFLILFSGKT